MNSAPFILAPDTHKLPYGLSMIPDGSVIFDSPELIFETVTRDGEVTILTANSYEAFRDFLPMFRKRGFRVNIVWTPSMQPNFNFSCVSYVQNAEDWVLRLMETRAELTVQSGIDRTHEIGITDPVAVEEKLRLGAQQPIHLNANTLAEINFRLTELENRIPRDRAELAISELSLREYEHLRRTAENLRASVAEQENELNSLREANEALIRDSLSQKQLELDAASPDVAETNLAHEEKAKLKHMNTDKVRRFLGRSLKLPILKRTR